MFTWDECPSDDPSELLHRIEVEAGLESPIQIAPATARTITYQVLASIAHSGLSAGTFIDIQEGYIDTSGYGGGPNGALHAFTIPAELRRDRDDDLYGRSGYRFWIVEGGGRPIIAVEQSSGTAWTLGREEQIDIMDLYQASNCDVDSVAAALLSRV